MNFLYLPQNIIYHNEVPINMQQYYRYCGAMNGGKQNHLVELLPQETKTEYDFSEYFFEFNDREIIFDSIIGGDDEDNVINILYIEED